MKRNRISLTLRIFITTSALLIAACAITYGTIAYLTPISYTAIMEDELDRQADALVAALEGVAPEDCEPLLESFVRQTGADVTLSDDGGNVLYDTMPAVDAVQGNGHAGAQTTANEAYDASTSTFIAAQSDDSDVVVESPDEMISVVTVVEDTSVAASEASTSYGHMYSFAFADGTVGWLSIQGGMRAVNQAVEALGRVLPFLIGIVLLISLGGSFFYAWFITQPIVAISKIARRMAALDFDARWTKTRRDEIGELGDSLNLLSDNLSQSLYQLEDANRKLQSDIERERALERQRMAFFAAASHELKTPITILKGQLSGMLARVGIYQDREKYLARALVVTGRMESLVKEILTINRIGADGFAVSRKAVDLSDLMRKQLELDRELIEQKALALHASIAPGVMIDGDEALLTKVLDNVLINAVLYSPPGELITVTVQDGGFTVENTGVSIPEDALPQLFTAFYRVEQSRNRKSGGSGLGLYLVASILDLHGARYGMENMPGGVRFSAAFPVKDED